MRTFLPGEISKEYRGDLSLAVGQDDKGILGGFLYPTHSDDFITVTGTLRAGTKAHKLERVYIGLTNEAGDKILREINGRKAEGFDFDPIERRIILHYFLSRD